MEPAPSKRWQQVEDLFGAALDRPVEARRAFLESACADTSLRAEVQRLLAAHEASEGFLEALDIDQAAALIDAEAESFHEGRRVGPYRIVRRLGRGGMGVVYLAHDDRLDRQVALKFLPPHLASDERAKQRLIAEAKAASALNHPGIAVVHEISETPDGHLFIAMAYCEGETLRQKIGRGPLPVDEALDLTQQVAEALAAAHARGIVHRDVKPGNVMVLPRADVPGSRAVATLMDFGIAKVRGAALTTAGATPGTVAYMSPEQTRGEAVDARTDLWSLGVVLYEMVTGERPFKGDHEQTLIYAIRHDAPEPVQRLRPEIPEALAAVVERCLEKESADRYPDAAALLTDVHALRSGSGQQRGIPWMRHGVAFMLLLFVMGVAGLLYVQQQSDEPGPSVAAETALPPQNRLAVLPLGGLSPGSDDAYVADGLTDELIGRLSTLDGLRVIARSSVLPYRDTDKGVGQIGRELNVGTVLDGSIRNSENQVRITLRLVDARREELLWTQQYEAALDDVLSIQREAAQQVIEALEVNVLESEQQHLLARSTDNPEAFRLYLKGRHFWNKRDAASFRQARDYFQQALDADPTYAKAWAGLADTYNMLASVDAVAPDHTMQLARAAAERALTFDADQAEAHAALGTILMSFYWEWEAAGEHLRQAVTIDPSYALGHQQYAQYLAVAERFDAAVREARQAQELDPLSLYARANTGWILYLAGRHDEAAEHLRQTISLDPDFGLAHLNLGLVYLSTDDVPAATEAFETLRALWGNTPTVQGLLGHAYARAGRSTSARQLLNELQQQQVRTPFHEAILHIGLGAHGEALSALEEAVERRAGLVMYLGVEPLMDPLRSDPRFEALLDTIGRPAKK